MTLLTLLSLKVVELPEAVRVWCYLVLLSLFVAFLPFLT